MRPSRRRPSHRSSATFLQVQPDAVTALVVSTWLAELPLQQHATAPSAACARRLCTGAAPDLILIDATLPDEDALDFASWIRATGSPRSKLLLFTARCDDALIYRASVSPALNGVVWRSSDARRELREAVTAVLLDEKPLSPRFLDAVRALGARPNAFYKILSDREISLLPHLGAGLDDTEIARINGLSASTVQTHRKRIMRKLGLHCVRELMCWTFRSGFCRWEASPSGIDVAG